MTSIWDDVVGQTVVPSLQAAASDAAAVVGGAGGASMTHAWLFVGPPGSGRSVVAKAFAAALQCSRGGCGSCAECRTARAGTHPDVALVSTEQLSLKVDDVRQLVPKASLRPARGRWQVVVVEDADRLTEDAVDALLLPLEEPASRTVWMLCAPTAEDLPATIRSRCRVVALRTPPPGDVAGRLQAEGVEPAMAAFAARASQGHVGRARALARDESTRLRRAHVLQLPFGLGDLGSCLSAAAALVAAADADAKVRCDLLDTREVDELKRVLGAGTTGVRPRHLGAAVRELEDDQRARRTRTKRDSIDRALVDLLALYRDVLILQLDAGGELVNDELRPSLERLARASSPEASLRRMEAVGAAREAVAANVAPLLALEAMAIQLRLG